MHTVGKDFTSAVTDTARFSLYDPVALKKKHDDSFSVNTETYLEHNRSLL